jgi:Tfp pilus assembly protein PilO
MSTYKPSKSKSSRPWILIVVPVLLVVLGLAGWQYLTYRSDRKALEAELAELKAEHDKLKKIAGDMDEIRGKFEAKKRRIERARKQIPASPDIKTFTERVKKYAQKAGYVTADFEHEEVYDDEKLYKQVNIETQLLGRKGNVSEVLKSLQKDPRLAILTYEGMIPVIGSATITLQVFYMPEEKQACTGEIYCDDGPASAVWLWPFTSRIKEIEEDMALTCDEMKEMGDEYLELCLIEKTYKEHEALTDIIQSLK